MKLCYQSEFGPEHMVTDLKRMEAYILKEWQSSAGSPLPPEDIGNQLVRFHLTEEYPPTASHLLAKLFCRTAQQHSGTVAGLEQRLETALLVRKDPQIQACFQKCRESGYPAVHHSDRFRETYHPHYRLLRRDYGCYFPLLLELEAMPSGVVAIDGPCGSGKTRLAEIIASVFDCNVFHMDDYYLPHGCRQQNWKEFPVGNIDFPRLIAEVLEPLQRMTPVATCAYHCRRDAFGEKKNYAPKPLTVLEGSYSLHPALAAYVDKRIFLLCDAPEQLRRLEKREGQELTSFQKLWIPMERRYHALYKPDIGAYVMNTSSFFCD